MFEQLPIALSPSWLCNHVMPVLNYSDLFTKFRPQSTISPWGFSVFKLRVHTHMLLAAQIHGPPVLIQYANKLDKYLLHWRNAQRKGNCQNVSISFSECQIWSEATLSTEGKLECWVHVYWIKRYAACLKHKEEHSHESFQIHSLSSSDRTYDRIWWMGLPEGKDSANLSELLWIRREKKVFRTHHTLK